jgi:hypothetical protein
MAVIVRFCIEDPLDMSREDSDIQDICKSQKMTKGVVKGFHHS